MDGGHPVRCAQREKLAAGEEARAAPKGSLSRAERHDSPAWGLANATELRATARQRRDLRPCSAANGGRNDESMVRHVPMVPDAAGPGDRAGLVSPIKALRLLSLLQSTLDELHEAPLDEPTRRSLIASYRAMLIEMAATVSEVLFEEMVRLHMAPLSPDASAAQLRIAQAQLVGWVMGLISAGGLVSGEPLGAATWTGAPSRNTSTAVRLPKHTSSGAAPSIRRCSRAGYRPVPAKEPPV